MPRDAFVLKIQRELCHPKCARKVSELSRKRLQEYSYSYIVKLVGVPELKQRESAYETSQLCLKICSAIGVDIKTYYIDIAHRVTPRHAAGAEGRPKPIVGTLSKVDENP